MRIFPCDPDFSLVLIRCLVRVPLLEGDHPGPGSVLRLRSAHHPAATGDPAARTSFAVVPGKPRRVPAQRQRGLVGVVRGRCGGDLLCLAALLVLVGAAPHAVHSAVKTAEEAGQGGRRNSLLIKIAGTDAWLAAAHTAGAGRGWQRSREEQEKQQEKAEEEHS